MLRRGRLQLRRRQGAAGRPQVLQLHCPHLSLRLYDHVRAQSGTGTQGTQGTA